VDGPPTCLRARDGWFGGGQGRNGLEASNYHEGIRVRENHADEWEHGLPSTKSKIYNGAFRYDSSLKAPA